MNHTKTANTVGKQNLIQQGMNVVADLGVGDKHSHVCLIDLDGRIIERQKVRTSQPALEKYCAPRAVMRVVFEAGTHANRLLERLGHEPLMADTHRLAALDLPHARDTQRSPAVFARDPTPPRHPACR